MTTFRCRGEREKVFGPGPRVPLDREAKIRVMAFAKAWNARHRQPGQHRGPLTRATTEVLEALLWGFHNAATGACFPSYEAIAAKAECCRDTVYEAIRALELAGVLHGIAMLEIHLAGAMTFLEDAVAVERAA